MDCALRQLGRILDGFENAETRLFNLVSAIEALIPATGPSGLSPEALATVKALTETIRASTAKQAAVVAANQPDTPQP